MIFNEFIIPGSTGKRPGTDVGASVVSKRPKLESGAKKEEPGVKKEENAGVAKKLQKDIRRLTRKVSWVTHCGKITSGISQSRAILFKTRT